MQTPQRFATDPLPKPTIHRLIQTLEEDGWLVRDLGGRGYVPGHRLRRMAANTLSGPSLRRERMAVLQRLAETVGETCNLAMPVGDMMVYVDRVETHWPLRIQLAIGSKVPLYCTASGKTHLSTLPPQQLKRLLKRLDLVPRTSHSIIDRGVLLDEITKVRERGFATDNQELFEGVIALAVPILDDKGRSFGTVSFHAPRQRMSVCDALEYLPDLRRTAVELRDTLSCFD